MLRRVAVPALAVACYAGVTAAVTVEWFDPLSDDRSSWTRDVWPIVFIAYVLVHPFVGFVIGRLWALALAAAPIAGAAWAEADCEGSAYFDFCGWLKIVVAVSAVFLFVPLLATGAYFRALDREEDRA